MISEIFKIFISKTQNFLRKPNWFQIFEIFIFQNSNLTLAPKCQNLQNFASNILTLYWNLKNLHIRGTFLRWSSNDFDDFPLIILKHNLEDSSRFSSNLQTILTLHFDFQMILILHFRPANNFGYTLHFSFIFKWFKILFLYIRIPESWIQISNPEFRISFPNWFQISKVQNHLKSSKI